MMLIFLIAAHVALSVGVGPPACPNRTTRIDWFEANTLTLVGSHFDNDPVKNHPYHRLPAAAEGVVRSVVWSLSLDTAGFAVSFLTDPAVRSIYVNYTLSSSNNWIRAHAGHGGIGC